jgi:hypothetical protein
MKYKTCWLAKQYKKGWKLRLCVGNKDYYLPKVWFSCGADIAKVLKGNIVFVEMAGKR